MLPIPFVIDTLSLEYPSKLIPFVGIPFIVNTPCRDTLCIPANLIYMYSFFKGQDSKKNKVWPRKFPGPFIVMSLWNYFYTSQRLIFGQKVCLPTFLKVTSVFIQIQPFYLWPVFINSDLYVPRCFYSFFVFFCSFLVPKTHFLYFKPSFLVCLKVQERQQFSLRYNSGHRND